MNIIIKRSLAGFAIGNGIVIILLHANDYSNISGALFLMVAAIALKE